MILHKKMQFGASAHIYWPKDYILITCNVNYIFTQIFITVLGVDRLSAPILSILPIIDIGHFQNIFADISFFIYIYIFFIIIFIIQTYYLQVTLFIGE